MSSNERSEKAVLEPYAGAANATDVAIVGMAGRFPGAADVDAFWANVRGGIESVSFFTDEELTAAGVPAAVLRDPNYVKASAVLNDIDTFDAAFFGLTPREVEIIDPQQRLFLECAWTALEDAGYDPEQYEGAIGVYGGAGVNMYATNVQRNPELVRTVGRMQAVLGNDKDFLTTRVAYKLNLRGPSITIQTACSTSLVAVHVAAHAVRTHECDMALAGGCSIGLEQHRGYMFEEGGVFAPDGHCRAFDAKARGFICGSGVALVVLKRLSDALSDGDHIYAVIKGSAVNNDGSRRIGFTAPSVEGQARAIKRALARASVDPETIGYVEAHGTGTVLGDPIEIAALTEAFRATSTAKQFCAIGSVKTNVGHLDAAAGVAGLIKTAMALEHGEIPPSLHFERANPQIDFATSPFFVNTVVRKWDRRNGVRRAAVSSLGLGGTNAHVVLEEAPAHSEPRPPQRRWQLLVASARTHAALETATVTLVDHLKRHPHLDCADVAYTLQVGRHAMRHRSIVPCTDLADAVRRLESRTGVRTATAHPDERTPSIVFVFPGGGAQHVNMAREVYLAESCFRQEVDACAEHLRAHVGEDIRGVLYPRAGGEDQAARRLESAALGLPALFTIEYALARQWMQWGIQPSAMIGHSLGEYVAACLAGVLSLPDALALVAARGRLFDRLPEGAMVSVPLPVADVEPLLEAGTTIAAVNGPSACVASGPLVAVERLERSLAQRGVDYRRLNISVAAHSPMVEPMLEPFRRAVRGLRLDAPRIPYISNVTGTWITPAEATDSDYWARHLRETVRYHDGVQELLRSEMDVMLEVGPGQGLTSLMRRSVAHESTLFVPSLGHADDAEPSDFRLTSALGSLWLAGAGIDWHRYARPGQRRVRLPTYPFERQRYWIEEGPAVDAGGAGPDLIARHSNVSDWFHVPCWRPSPHARSRGTPRTVLVFTSGCGLDARLVERLRVDGCEVVTARAGNRYDRSSRHEYEIDAGCPSDYELLLESLSADGLTPDAVLHFWTMPTRRSVQESLRYGYYSLLFLAQALDRLRAGDLLLFVVSTKLFDVSGAEECCPEQATLLGPCQVIPQEYLNLRCRVVDVVLPPAGSEKEARLVDELCAEIDAPPADWAVALRGSTRLVQDYQPLRLENEATATGDLRQGGVYLITGGLGTVGLQLAGALARAVQARLVLVTRSSFPPESAWAAYAAHDGASDRVARAVGHIRQFQAHGSEVMVLTADVAVEAEMRSVIAAVRERFGALHGVFHAAGITTGDSVLSPISRIGVQHSEEQFRPKVYGLQVLDRLLAEQPLDFCLLFSSNASVLGGLGLVAYSAANHFMNAFATAKAAAGGGAWISASWDGWPSAPSETRAFTTSIEQFAMTADESIGAVNRLIAHRQVGHVVVSAGELGRRLDLWIRRPRAVPASSQRPCEAQHARPDLRGRFVPPENDLQRTIATVWQDLFGIKDIGIHDNFFELGGNSLVATQVVSRLRALLSTQLPLRHVFIHPTIAELAAAVTALGETAPPSAVAIEKAAPLALEDVLGPVDRLSDEQVDAALAELLQTPADLLTTGEEAE